LISLRGASSLRPRVTGDEITSMITLAQNVFCA